MIFQYTKSFYCGHKLKNVLLCFLNTSVLSKLQPTILMIIQATILLQKEERGTSKRHHVPILTKDIGIKEFPSPDGREMTADRQLGQILRTQQFIWIAPSANPPIFVVLKFPKGEHALEGVTHTERDETILNMYARFKDLTPKHIEWLIAFGWKPVVANLT